MDFPLWAFPSSGQSERKQTICVQRIPISLHLVWEVLPYIGCVPPGREWFMLKSGYIFTHCYYLVFYFPLDKGVKFGFEP